MTIGGRIAEARERKGWKPEDLADRLGVTRVAVEKWERGDNNPKTGRLDDIARELDVTVEWLLSSEDDAAAALGEMLDPAVVRAAIIAGEKDLAAYNLLMATPEEKADHIFAIYRFLKKYDEPGKLDPAAYPNVLSLVRRHR